MKICVIGSFCVDYISKTNYKLIKGESHPGSIKVNPGGVARNIVENLARMNLDITFITAIGSDYYGQRFKNELNDLNVKIEMPVISNNHETSMYFAINNKEGNLEYAVVNNNILESINKTYLESKIDYLNSFDYIVLDTNVSIEAIDFLFKNINVKIIVDAVSMIKSEKLKDYLDKIYILKTNEREFIHLQQHMNSKKPTHLIKTMGSKNIVYFYNDEVYEYKPIKKEKIVSTTGAGDAFLSGVIYALTMNKTVKEAIKMGSLFSYYTLDVEEKVNKNIKSLINRHFEFFV